MKESKLSKIETIERTFKCIMSRLSKKQKSALQDVIDEAKENLESLKGE